MPITVSAFPTAANAANGITALPAMNERHLLDAQFITTLAAPNNTNVVNTNAFNLVQAVPYPVTEKIEVQLILSGSINAANAKNVNVILQHSNVNTSANFTNIGGAPIMVCRQNTGTNTYTNSTQNVMLDRNTLQYIRAQMTGDTNLLDSSDATLTLQIAF